MRRIFRPSVVDLGGGRYTDRTMPPPDSAAPPMLVVDGRPVAPAVVAAGRRARTIGLLGRDGFDGALLLPGTRSVHAIGMRFALDVALCNDQLDVVACTVLRPGRLVLPRRRVRLVVEAEAGAFERWGLRPGSNLAISGWPAPPRR